MLLTDLTDAPADTWDALAARSPLGEALQSHAWGEVKAAAGWTMRRYRVDDVTGAVGVVSIQERDLAAPVVRRVPGAIREPMRRVGGALGRFLYAPLGPVLLRDDAAAAATTLRALREIARRRRAAMLVIDPCWEVGTHPASLLAAAGFAPAARAVQVSTTGMYVPLHVDDDGQRSLLNQNVRRNIERCRKAGVTVRRLGADSESADLGAALASAYAMLVATGRRRGFGDVLRPATYHDAAQERLIRSGNASLFIASLGDLDLAYTLVHHSGARAVLFEAGEADPGPTPDEAAGDTPRFAANFLLQWSINRWAAGAGFQTYDMSGVDNHAAPGLPRDESHPLWSLFRFKSQWGARPVQFVGAWEYAPRPLMGAGLRLAWGAGDRIRARGRPVSTGG